MSLKLTKIVLLLTIPMTYATSAPDTPDADLTAGQVDELLHKVFNLEIVHPVICAVGRECVPRHLCLDDGTVNKDGRDVVDFRINEFPDCPELQTCCALDRQIAEKIKNSGSVPSWHNNALFLGTAILYKYFWSRCSL